VALIVTWGAAAAIAVGWLWAGGAAWGAILPVVAAFAVIAFGVGLGWGGGPDRLEWAWRVQAVGAGLVAVAWLTAIVGMG
jgi:hypothetical protein